MLEPLELSCRIQGLEQPRVTPNLDLDAMPRFLGWAWHVRYGGWAP
jgi:hypothetical protein